MKFFRRTIGYTLFYHRRNKGKFGRAEISTS
jgi:hypothetical protein